MKFFKVLLWIIGGAVVAIGGKPGIIVEDIDPAEAAGLLAKRFKNILD